MQWIEKVRETQKRHANMDCKVYELKVVSRKLSHTTDKHLKKLFLEAKYVYNYTVAHYAELTAYPKKEVEVKCADHFETRELKHLSSQMIQGVYQSVKQAIKGLAQKKRQGEKVGRLKFKAYKNSIPLNQYGITYKLDRRKNTVKLQGLKTPLKVRGMKQLPDNVEFANAQLVRKPSGYYIHVCCFMPKQEHTPKGHVVGIDFGIQHNLTTTDGELIDIKVPETKAVKLASKRLNKAYAKTKSKKSHNHRKYQAQLQRAYEKQNNKKKDMANKVVHHLTHDYDLIAIQDELISAWHKGLFGKHVQKSTMGAIKQGLKSNPHTLVVPASYASTQACPRCGKNTKHTLDKRDYQCESCGYSHPSRDIKSAAMILLEALKTVSLEQRTQSSVELAPSTLEQGLTYVQTLLFGKELAMKQEAHGFSLG